MAKTRRQKQATRQRASARKRAEDHGTGFQNTVLTRPDNCSFFSIKEEGNRRIDIIEYVVPEEPKSGPNPFARPGELYYERTFYHHRNIGADGKTYVCPRKTMGKRCPICDDIDKMQKESDVDPDAIKALLPKERQLFNVYDRDEPSKGVQLWEISFHNFGKQLDKEIKHADEDEGYDTFWYANENGWTLRIGFEKVSFAGTSYCKAATVGFKKRETPIPDGIKNEVLQLDNLLTILPYEQLNAIFLMEEQPANNGEKLDNNNDDDDDDDDEPVQRKKKKRKTASSLGIEKGTECYYTNGDSDSELCTVLKITGDTKLKLAGEDEVYTDIDVEDVTVGKSKSEASEEEEEETMRKRTMKKKLVKEQNDSGKKVSTSAHSEKDGNDWDEGWD